MTRPRAAGRNCDIWREESTGLTAVDVESSMMPPGAPLCAPRRAAAACIAIAAEKTTKHLAQPCRIFIGVP
jgi:hypothetical protein